MFRKKIFICSRIGAKDPKDFEMNLKKMRLYSRWATLQGHDAEATGFYYCMYLDDFSEAERKLGQELGRERMRSCSKILVVNEQNRSEGMKGDIDVALKLHLEFIFKTHEEIVEWLKTNDPAAQKMFPELLA